MIQNESFLTLKEGRNNVNYRYSAYLERMDAACAELFSIAERYFSGEIVGSYYHKKHAVNHAVKENRNIQRLFTQLGILNNFFTSISEIGAAGQAAVIRGYEALKDGEIAKPLELSVPRSPSEFFRRDFLRGMFNAVRVRNESGKMESFQLGGLWFRSADDQPRNDMRIPE